MSALDASPATALLLPLCPCRLRQHGSLAFPQEQPLGLWPLLPWTRCPSEALPAFSGSCRFLLTGSLLPSPTYSSP